MFEEVFGELADGTFVEVGANDGLGGGVTPPLADMGWTGVYVEANPHEAQTCANNHMDNPNVRVVNRAIKNRSGKATLWGAGMGATCDPEYREVAKNISWAGIGNSPGIDVKCMTLQELLERCDIKPGFELLSVDVEGGELEVFDSFDLKEWMPKMLVVEMTDDHPDFVDFDDLNAKYAALRARILDHGYKEIYRDIINTVYVRSGD